MNNKVVIAGVVVVLLAVAGVAVYVTQNIDGLVKSLVEQVGSDVTKTQVQVAEVKMNVSDGNGQLSGLTVANPPGFTIHSMTVPLFSLMVPVRFSRAT